MSNDINKIDISKLKYWQVMDPAPEFLQVFDDPILVAKVFKAQAEFKRASIKTEMQNVANYYDSVVEIFDDFIGPKKGR